MRMSDDKPDSTEAQPSPLAARRQPPQPPARKQASGWETALGCAGMLVLLVLVFFGIRGCAQWTVQRNAAEAATAEAYQHDLATQTAAAPTETPQHRVQRIIKDGLTGCTADTVSVNGGTVVVNLSCINMHLSNLHAYIVVSTLETMKRLYTSRMQPQSVTVNVNGTLYDQYGKPSPALFATATLTAQTATKFYWNNLSGDQAWNDYDKAWMRDDILYA